MVERVVVPPKRLRKEISRYSRHQDVSAALLTQGNPNFAHIRICTPTPKSPPLGTFMARSRTIWNHSESTRALSFRYPPLPIISLRQLLSTDELSKASCLSGPKFTADIEPSQREHPFYGSHFINPRITQFGVDTQGQQNGDELLKVGLSAIGNAFGAHRMIAMMPAELTSLPLNELVRLGDTAALLTTALFLMSNGLLRESGTHLVVADYLLQWLELHGKRTATLLLSSASKASLDAVLDDLFFPAIFAQNLNVLRRLDRQKWRLNETRVPPDCSKCSRNAPDTPVRYACAVQNIELLQLLISAGAYVSPGCLYQALTDMERQWIHSKYHVERSAAQHRSDRFEIDHEVIQLLLQSGARVCICNSPEFWISGFRELRERPLEKAAQLQDTDLMSQLLHSTPQPCGQCLFKAQRTKTENNPKILELLLDAGAEVTVETAVSTGNLQLLRRVIQKRQRFTLEEVGNVLEQDNLDFIMHALDLYYEENGSSSNQWSKHGASSGQSSNRLDPIPSPGLEADIQRHFPESTFGDTQELQVERRILRAVLALPEHKHEKYLSKCFCGAVKANSKRLIQLLIHEGAMASWYTLTLAVMDKDPAIISALIRSFYPNNRIMDTPSLVETALKRGDMEILDQVLKVDAFFPIGVVEIHGGITSGAKKDNDEALIRLLAHKVDIHPQQKDYMFSSEPTVLGVAVGTGKKELVQQLLHYGASPFDQNALALAVDMGSDMVDTLLTACSLRSLYRSAGFGCRALRRAVEKSDESIVRLLLNFGVRVDVDVVNVWAGTVETALEAAICLDRSSNLKILKMLLETLGNPDALIRRGFGNTTSPLLDAIEASNAGAIDLLLSKGANPNSEAGNVFFRTPLQAAVEEGSVDLVKRLLHELRVDVNASPAKGSGSTALQLAARLGYIELARVLLAANADVNAPRARFGYTALEEATGNGRTDMISLLVHSGAQIMEHGQKTHQFKRAKDLAILRNRPAAADYLESLYSEQMESLCLETNFCSSGSNQEPPMNSFDQGLAQTVQDFATEAHFPSLEPFPGFGGALDISSHITDLPHQLDTAIGNSLFPSALPAALETPSEQVLVNWSAVLAYDQAQTTDINGALSYCPSLWPNMEDIMAENGDPMLGLVDTIHPEQSYQMVSSEL